MIHCVKMYLRSFHGTVGYSKSRMFISLHLHVYVYIFLCISVCLCLFGQCECEKQRIHNDQWLMREENPLVMILIELCHMTSTWNMSCDQSQVDIYCIEPTLNFYINLKMALFLFIQGRIQRSICMHKMDYIFDITGRNVEKSDSQVILFFSAYFCDLPGHTSIIFPFDMHAP